MNQQKAQAWFYNMLSNHKKFMRKEIDPHPIWLVWRKDGKDFSMQIPNERSDPSSPMLKIAVLLKQHVPDIWITFSEGWMHSGKSELSKEQLMNMFNRGDIEKLPDKLETLTVIGKTSDLREVINESYWLIRDKEEKLIDFKKSPMSKLKAMYLP